MTASNGGELGKSLLSKSDTEYIISLDRIVDDVVARYEQKANEIFNKIKNMFKTNVDLGMQKLANCFRCSNTGSVNTNRLEQRTYIPSFEIPDLSLANEFRNKLNKNVFHLIPLNSNNVQIYVGALIELLDKLEEANSRGFLYLPAMIKSNLTTMNDVTKFRKIDKDGKNDKGIFTSTLALQMKFENILKITSLLQTENTTNYPSTSATLSPTTYPQETTLAPNPDDLQNFNFCGQTYETIDCNKPCKMGLNLECNETETCFLITNDICK